MSEESKIQEFPDIGSKLTAPTKKSIFERQKAEAEAKRKREEAETAAVYEDFVKSFEDSDATLPTSGTGKSLDGGGPPGAGLGFGGPPKRHYAAPPSGPAAGRGAPAGSRGAFASAGPGSLGPPPPSLSRKRAHDGPQATQRDNNQGLFAFENSSTGPVDAATAFQTSDDEEDKTRAGKSAERAAPKPTLHLSSLPPGTSPAVIKSLLPQNLVVDAVRIVPPSGPGTMERRSFSAIVTLTKDTPANDIDNAVNGLSNKYLGWGFYLSLSRHLSSAALGTVPQLSAGPISSLSSMPFGARPIPMGPGGPMNRAPPPNPHRGGFAPPASFAPTGPGQYGRGAPPLRINVNPPSDLKQLKSIHKTLEALLTHGPEFEALLMSRLEVQREEKWAWLWDPRSPGGVWYRWRLWEILTSSQKGRNRNQGRHLYVFDGAAVWAAPEKGLLYEYITQLDEFVSNDEYDSSEDEDSGDEGHRRHHGHHGGAPPPDTNIGGADGDGKAYLNPLRKAKLTHLLARLPTTNAKLRKGDVARVTAFAIEHAGEGADEVVDMIVSNIGQPFAHTTANPDRKKDVEEGAEEDTEDKERTKEKEDTSPSRLIALYLISDILSSSSTSGVRHAWRYRQLFESALKEKKVFESLGRLEKEMQWGRLRAEKWKRSVGSVLSLWEGWCVFPQASQEHFAAVFTNPPPTAAEEMAIAAANTASGIGSTGAAKSRWKTVDVKAHPSQSPRPVDLDAAPTSKDEEDEMDVDVDGEPMADDDLDGEPMDEDLDGEAMDSDIGGEAVDESNKDTSTEQRIKPNPPSDADTSANAAGSGFKVTPQGMADRVRESLAASARRRRPKAEDMFADSDEE
ncbi:MAG: hypothetical protein M1827_002750 [Pycnora praestabilis]|nr:MAG: hypothetical protein M1827_002750 [Pycnora praestabilis]